MALEALNKPLHCPNCAANLNVKDAKGGQLTCDFCGTIFGVPQEHLSPAPAPHAAAPATPAPAPAAAPVAAVAAAVPAVAAVVAPAPHAPAPAPHAAAPAQPHAPAPAPHAPAPAPHAPTPAAGPGLHAGPGSVVPPNGKKLPPRGAVLLETDLSGGEIPEGWTAQDEEYIAVDNSALTLTFPKGDEWWLPLETDEEYDDVDVGVNVQFASVKPGKSHEPAYVALLLRGNEDGYYVVALSSKGQVSAWWESDEEAEEMLEEVSHPAIDTTPGAVNRLRVVAKGEKLVIFINDMPVNTVRDDPEAYWDTGTISVGVWTQDNTTEIVLSDVQVRETS